MKRSKERAGRAGVNATASVKAVGVNAVGVNGAYCSEKPSIITDPFLSPG